MTNSNGYIIVDCNGLDLSKDTEQTVAGIYQKTKDAMKTKKSILCVNTNWDGRPITPIQVFGWLDGDTIYMNSCILQVSIKTDDKATVAVNPAIPS